MSAHRWLSFIMVPLLATLLLNWYSWPDVLICWVLQAQASAAVYSNRGKGGDFPGLLPGPENVRHVISNPSFWIMVFLFAMAMGGNAGIYSILPLFFVKERGYDLTLANMRIGLPLISGAVKAAAFFKISRSIKAQQKHCVNTQLCFRWAYGIHDTLVSWNKIASDSE